MDIDTLLAREGIRETLATYNMAGDRLQLDDFMSVFTEDAVLHIQDGAFSSKLEGASAIRDWFAARSRSDAEAAPARRASFVRHHLSTCKIQLTDGDAAQVRTYWTANTDIGADHGGQYVDAFRRSGERWLIAHRRVRIDWRAADSLFARS